MRKKTSKVWVALLIGSLTACTGHQGGDAGTPGAVKAPAGGVLLRGAGSTFVALLFKRWFTQYQHDHPTVAVAYDVVGSGEGVRRFMGGKGVEEKDAVEFGASDSAMSDDQLAVAPDSVMVPVTAGSLVIAYNLPGVTGDLKLSRTAYAGIFLGKVTSWDDPVIAKDNPGVTLPKTPIAVVVRADSSGTTFAFTNHLSAISDEWKTRCGAKTMVAWPGEPMRAPGNEGVAGRIKLSEGAIGYLNYGSAQQAALPMAVLENKEGAFIKPTPQSGTQTLAAAALPENLRLFIPDPAGKDSYPIVTFSWILLHKQYADQGKADALAALLRWCLTDGQKAGPEMGYVPLPDGVAAKALAAVNGLRAGAAKVSLTLPTFEGRVRGTNL